MILCVCVCRKIDRDRVNVLKLRPLYIERIVPYTSHKVKTSDGKFRSFHYIQKRFSSNKIFNSETKNVSILCCKTKKKTKKGKKNAATVSRRERNRKLWRNYETTKTWKEVSRIPSLNTGTIDDYSMKLEQKIGKYFGTWKNARFYSYVNFTRNHSNFLKVQRSEFIVSRLKNWRTNRFDIIHFDQIYGLATLMVLALT